MDSLFCGKATGRRTCHWHGRWDGPFESTLESKMSNPCGVTQTGSPQSRLALWGKEPQQNERTVTLKKSPQAIWRLRRRGGGGWIRTIEGKASRFTVCPLWPLGYSSVFGWAEEGGAGGRIRTPDLLITNQLLYRLSYTSTEAFRVHSGAYYNSTRPACQPFFKKNSKS